MLAATLLMFAISLSHLALQMCFLSVSRIQEDDVDGIIINGFGLQLAPVALISTNVLMGDGIVLWRMCVVWLKNRKVVMISMLVILCTLGTLFSVC